MQTIRYSEALALATAINDEHSNPARAYEAMLVRDRWLIAGDLGEIIFEAGAREVLEQA